MFRIIAYMYLGLLYIYSPFVNLFVLIKNNKSIKKMFHKDLFEGFMKDLYLEKIQTIMKSKSYISDPKLFGNFTFNYIPFLISFIIQDGGDCSVFARIIARMIKKTFPGKNVKLWLITDKRFSLKQKIERSHVVCTFDYFDFTYISDVRKIVSLKSGIPEYFKKKSYIDNAGRKFQYKDPLVVRWF